jgi:hypothetical protein
MGEDEARRLKHPPNEKELASFLPTASNTKRKLEGQFNF